MKNWLIAWAVLNINIVLSFIVGVLIMDPGFEVWFITVPCLILFVVFEIMITANAVVPILYKYYYGEDFVSEGAMPWSPEEKE